MSRKTIASFLLLFTLISCYAQKSEEKLVRKLFEDYKTSILNDRGEEAANYVDSRTIAYYAEMLEKAKHADSAEVNTLGILDKIMVFSIRHRASREEILSFDGRGLFIYAIEEGMVGKSSVANNTIGTIEVEGDFAKGQLVVNGKAAPYYFHFYKEEGSWRLNLTSFFPISELFFEKRQEDSGMPENDYIFMLLERLTGNKPGSEIWNRLE